MLVNIQHSAQAVLQAATACLQTALQHHRHWHRPRDSSGPALLQQHLRELQASMASLHLHLTHWQEVRTGRAGPCTGVWAGEGSGLYHEHAAGPLGSVGKPTGLGLCCRTLAMPHPQALC